MKTEQWVWLVAAFLFALATLGGIFDITTFEQQVTTLLSAIGLLALLRESRNQ